MYMHSFDLWAYAFLSVEMMEAFDESDEAELDVELVEFDVVGDDN